MKKPRRREPGSPPPRRRAGECVDRLIPTKQRRDATDYLPMRNIDNLSDRGDATEGQAEAGAPV
jgi:hypothetical protein